MEFTFDLQRFDRAFNGGSGTEADPYEISSVTDLQALANYVNAGTDYNGTYFKLTADIDLKYSEWTPIGTNGEFPFKGTFDGGNHTISKLKVSEGNVNAGLFGINGGTIKNVTLTGVNVTGTSNVGGLVGTNVGTVDNCIVSGTVTGTGSDAFAGGLVGNNDTGIIKNSISVATVSVGSGSPYGGGLVGTNSGTINGTNYYYTAPALGGESGSENCIKLYKLTLQTGVTVTGGTKWTVDGTTYAADEVTLSATASNAVIKSTNYTNNDDGTVSVTLNADADLSNAVDFYYAVNIPNCVQSVSGTSYGGNYPNYYKNGSTLNLTAKTGYVVDSVTVSADTSITATLAQGHYVFSDGDGYTLATNDNVAENNYPNLVQVYKLTLPEGVTVSGNIVVTDDDGTTYAAGTLTLSATASNAVIKSTNYTNNDDGTVSGTLNADADLSNAVDFYYAVNIPNCVQSVSGTSYGGNYPNYYKNGSTLNLTAKTGYVVDSVTVSSDTSITATLAQGHYAFSDGDGYTLATNDNVAENNYPDLVKVYKLTLPEGVTVSGDIVVTDDGTNYAAGEVTLSATASNAVIKSTKYTNNADGTVSVTLNADADLSNTVDFYYAVNIPNCVQSVSGTSYGGNYSDYYKYGSTLNLTAKTGYVVDNVTVSADTSITATLAQGHYVFSDGDGYTLATNTNVAENNYPDLVKVYKLTLPEGVTVSGNIVVTDDDGTTYAAGEVTLAAAAGYILQNIKVNGESLDGNTFTVSADATVLADSFKFNNADISKATAVTVGGTTGDLSTFSGIYSITAAQENSTLVGNAKNNTIFIAGGDENILTGGSGNDAYKFTAGGGIVTDFGIGATKSGDGKTLSTTSTDGDYARGVDIVKVTGKVSGVYFDRDDSGKNSATFTAVITYDSDGDSTADEVIVLKDIAKKPTKTGSKPVYQTNDVAAATLKIWDTSGSSGKQAVLSASKLKKLFHDDDELSTDLLTQVASLGNLDGIGDLNLPAVDQLTATTQTYSGGNDS